MRRSRRQMSGTAGISFRFPAFVRLPPGRLPASGMTVCVAPDYALRVTPRTTRPNRARPAACAIGESLRLWRKRFNYEHHADRVPHTERQVSLVCRDNARNWRLRLTRFRPDEHTGRSDAVSSRTGQSFCLFYTLRSNVRCTRRQEPTPILRTGARRPMGSLSGSGGSHYCATTVPTTESWLAVTTTPVAALTV